MVRLYLDVESYREEDAFRNEKIVAIGVIEDWTPYSVESLRVEPFKADIGALNSGGGEEGAIILLFSEWEYGSEKEVIKEFYRYLKELMVKARFVNVVGFNILRFDIPLLTQRIAELGIDDISSINNLWYYAYTVDLFQVALPLNNMMFKNLKLTRLVETISHIAGKHGINVYVNPPKPYGKGGDVVKWYREGKYRDIENHLEADLKAARYIDLLLRAIVSKASSILVSEAK